MIQKMDPVVKKKWLNALRSGEYEQGQGVLHDVDDSYCCLGVLCHLAHLEGKVSRGVEPSDLGGYWYGDKELSLLPLEVQEWAGLRHPDPHLAPVTQGHKYIDPTLGESVDFEPSASHFNDLGFGFDTIADLIEENL